MGPAWSNRTGRVTCRSQGFWPGPGTDQAEPWPLTAQSWAAGPGRKPIVTLRLKRKGQGSTRLPGELSQCSSHLSRSGCPALHTCERQPACVEVPRVSALPQDRALRGSAVSSGSPALWSLTQKAGLSFQFPQESFPHASQGWGRFPSRSPGPVRECSGFRGLAAHWGRGPYILIYGCFFPLLSLPAPLFPLNIIP